LIIDWANIRSPERAASAIAPALAAKRSVRLHVVSLPLWLLGQNGHQLERPINSSIAPYATFEISASRWQSNARLHQFGGS
jgi:hypothetical protein